jgi:hypothetical protein
MQTRRKRERENIFAHKFRVYPKHENETLKKFVVRETLERRKTTDNELSSFTHQREDDSDELQFFLLKKRFDDLSFCVVTIVKTCLFII